MNLAPPSTERVQIGRPLIRLDEVGSTMDLATALAADGAPAGTTVLAGHQSAGRGRAGRVWETSPWSAVLLSFIVDSGRDPVSLGILSPLLGLAVAEAIDRFVPERAEVKWPNDVLVGERKIAGILVSNRVIPGRFGRTLIVGVGLNVSAVVGQLPPPATSLAIASGTAVTLDDVLPVLLDRLSSLVTRFEAGDVEEERARLDGRLAFRGEAVEVEDGARTLRGVVRGVAADGALLLDAPDGPAKVVSGDLTRGPRPASGGRVDR